MKTLLRIITVFTLLIFYSFSGINTTYAQTSDCTIVMSAVDKITGNKIEIPPNTQFQDNELYTIHYDVSWTPGVLPGESEKYMIITDGGQTYHPAPLTTIGDYVSGLQSPILDPTDNKYHLTGDINKLTSELAFLPKTHTLKVKLRDEDPPKCTLNYEIAKGTTQTPIECGLDIVSTNQTDPTIITPNDPFYVVITLTRGSDRVFSLNRPYKYLNAIDATNQLIKIQLANEELYARKSPFQISGPNALKVLVPASKLQTGHTYRIVMSFIDPPPSFSTIGECAFDNLKICLAQDQCKIPSSTPTPSPTPTNPVFCHTCSPATCSGQCLACNFCKPTVPPLPDLKPLCDQIGQGDLGTSCRECIDPPKAGIWTAVGCVPTNPAEFIKEYVFTTGVGIAGGVAFLYFIYGSFLVLTSAGNAERVEEAKAIITSSITGLLFIIFSVLLLRIIGVDILRIPGFS